MLYAPLSVLGGKRKISIEVSDLVDIKQIGKKRSRNIVIARVIDTETAGFQETIRNHHVTSPETSQSPFLPYHQLLGTL
jgi:hypothetical protein